MCLRFEHQQTIVKDELAKMAQRERETAREEVTKAMSRERQHARQEAEKAKELVHAKAHVHTHTYTKQKQNKMMLGQIQVRPQVLKHADTC